MSSMVTFTQALVPSGQLRERRAWAAGVTAANTTRMNRTSCAMDLGFDSTMLASSRTNGRYPDRSCRETKGILAIRVGSNARKPGTTPRLVMQGLRGVHEHGKLDRAGKAERGRPRR